MATFWADRCAEVRNSPRKLRDAWRRGVLWFLLDEHQYRVYVRIRQQIAKPRGTFTLKWARRTGKTFVLVVIVLEELLRHRGHRYNFAAATKESLKQFIWPTIHAALATCPGEMRPRVKDQESAGRVMVCHATSHGLGHRCKEDPQHSWAVLAGLNDARAIERLRGPFSHGNVHEEIGAWPESPSPSYVRVSVLNPQLLTTGGWTLNSGTPPKSTAHESAAFFQQAELKPESYDYATLYDNPRLTPEQIEAYLQADADELGMTREEYKASTHYRREWLALVETDPTIAVLPPCTPERMFGPGLKPKPWRDDADPREWHWNEPGTGPVVRVMPDVPLFRDRYESMDLGFFPHFTHVLFAYWDYARQVLVIEDELQMRQLNDTRLAHLIGGAWKRDDGGRRIHRVALEGEDAAKVGPYGMEHRLWGEQPPFMRVADNNYPMTLAELSMVHGFVFTATAKDELEAAIVHVCRWIREGKLAVHPRCRHLIAQMQAATWNKARTEFAQSAEFGHFDAVAALVYLVRNVIPHMGRVPHGWGHTQDTHVGVAAQPETPERRALRKAFGG